MPYVLDASIAACWCLHDEHDVRASAAFELLDKDKAFAPVLWWFEIRNVLLFQARQNRVTEHYVSNFLLRLGKFSIELAALPGDEPVFVLARKHRLTFYDAAYLELAKRENVSLATLDNHLARAAIAEGVPLIGVS